MSDGKNAFQSRMAAAAANAKVLETFIPQCYASPKDITHDPEAADVDIQIFGNHPPDVILPLNGLEAIAIADHRPELMVFCRSIRKDLKGVDGFTLKHAVEMAGAITSGGKNRTLKKRGWVTRNVTHRGEPEYENAETGEPTEE